MSQKTKRPYKLIFNPRAGYGRHPWPFFSQISRYQDMKRKKGDFKDLKRIMAYFESKALLLDVTIITREDNASDIVSVCHADDYEAVLVAGGDGTINTVVNGLVGTGLPLGIIPTGSVNVMARELNIPMDIEKACERIVSGHVEPLDLGVANDRYFVSFLGVGFDAAVVRRTSGSLKKKQNNDHSLRPNLKVPHDHLQYVHRLFQYPWEYLIPVP
jgi:hypothetical protein